MLIGMAGYAGSGKDTVGNYLVAKYGFTRFAFADALKEIAYILNPIIDYTRFLEEVRLARLVDQIGWNQAKKRPEVRRILQVLGTECGRDILGKNIWVDIINRRIKFSVDNVIITDVRFQNEVDFIKDTGLLWWIDRTGITPLNEHSSENSVTRKDADFNIVNDNNLDTLYAKLDDIMKGLRD